MIYDCFQFFNELDLLKLRLNILHPVVDFFVISESTLTFSGEPKLLFYEENKDIFKEFHHKILHNIVKDTPNLSNTSPFERDGFEKAARMRKLVDCKKNDIIMFSDLDEIPNPLKIKEVLRDFNNKKIYHFAQRQFYFFLNLEEKSGNLLSYAGEFEGIKHKNWLGTYMLEMSLLNKFSIEELRVNKTEKGSVRVNDGGWHFTYMGGDRNLSPAERAAFKVRSAAHQEFNNEVVLSNIEKNISKKKDIFGRDSNFQRVEIDDSYPEYLVNNINEYEYLILPPKSKNKIFKWLSK
jgi:beta-1,4-mannosyl-glycoprotein beta-1,4-N-acetylglucosaminyltransferase